MNEPVWLEKAQGYLELGMLDEAWDVIEALPPDEAVRSDAQEMRVIILLDRKEFEEALSLCRNLVLMQPENHAGFIQGAYALHSLQQTQKAIDFLQTGPTSLREEQCYFYNLACYEVALGRTEAALTWLLQSIELDPRNRIRALADADLEILHDKVPPKET
ncbi:MAG: hypothetical protein P1U58_06495 [Verrucomicrobiales bacterium]|nr:hypothetical protein [Verrucomicrobiales bacterium]